MSKEKIEQQKAEEIKAKTVQDTPDPVRKEPETEQAPEKDQQKAQEAERIAERRKKLHKRHMKALRDLIIRILSLALVIYVLFYHLVGIMLMPSSDMYPRIDTGDLVLFYRLERNFHAQDVVVFRKPTAALEASYEHEEEEATGTRREKTAIRKALDWLGFADPADPPMTTFVCRVVAGPGDTVEIGEGERLVVNGNAMIESNIFYSTPEYAGFVEYPLTLGEGQYFVLADNRHGGADSRFFGAVNEDEILGTVITIARRNNL